MGVARARQSKGAQMKKCDDIEAIYKAYPRHVVK